MVVIKIKVKIILLLIRGAIILILQTFFYKLIKRGELSKYLYKI
jgi:hypothetical protein